MSKGAKFLEIETKYRVRTSLEEFDRFCKDLGPSSSLLAAGYDHFYSSDKEPESFVRHRFSPVFNQLTLKRKTTDANNYVRTEHNITLGEKVTTDQVKGLCKELGYTFNTSIFKNVFIHFYNKFNFVYYICYDNDMSELGRFIEIEMDENHPWETEDQAWQELLVLEHKARVLGVSPQARMKKSLFEQFRKA